MAKLTQTQKDVLRHCLDWSAAFEVAERRIEDGDRTDWKRTQDVLMSLQKRGLVEYGQANATYRITDAGRAALSPAPQPNVAGDDSPRYSMKRMRDEIAQAKAYARREALSEAATKAHSLIAADYVANNVRDQILALDGSGPWLPIDQADTSTDRIYDLPGMPSPIANSEEYWCRDADGRVFLATWADDGKRAYWWDLDGESPVDPIEFMPHPLDPRWSATTEGSR